jgi:fumarate reductase subunit D
MLQDFGRQIDYSRLLSETILLILSVILEAYLLTATDVYIRQIGLFPQLIQNVFFIFIMVLRTWKCLKPKDGG